MEPSDCLQLLDLLFHICLTLHLHGGHQGPPGTFYTSRPPCAGPAQQNPVRLRLSLESWPIVTGAEVLNVQFREPWRSGPGPPQPLPWLALGLSSGCLSLMAALCLGVSVLPFSSDIQLLYFSGTHGLPEQGCLPRLPGTRGTTTLFWPRECKRRWSQLSSSLVTGMKTGWLELAQLPGTVRQIWNRGHQEVAQSLTTCLPRPLQLQLACTMIILGFLSFCLPTNTFPGP